MTASSHIEPNKPPVFAFPSALAPVGVAPIARNPVIAATIQAGGIKNPITKNIRVNVLSKARITNSV